MARGQIDWRYLPGLELADPGFDTSALSEFRSRLVAGRAETLLRDTLLTLCRERKLLVPRGHQRTDSTHVLCRGAGMTELGYSALRRQTARSGSKARMRRAAAAASRPSRASQA